MRWVVAAVLMLVPPAHAQLTMDDPGGDVTESLAASAAGAHPAGADLVRITVSEQEAYVAFGVRLGDLSAFEAGPGLAGSVDITFPGLEPTEVVLLRATHGSGGGWVYNAFISGGTRALNLAIPGALDRANETIVMRLARYQMGDPGAGAAWGPFAVQARLGPAQDQQPNCMFDHCDTAASGGRTLPLTMQTGTGIRVHVAPFTLSPGATANLTFELTFDGPDTDPGTPAPPEFNLTAITPANWTFEFEERHINMTVGQTLTFNATVTAGAILNGTLALNITQDGRSTIAVLPVIFAASVSDAPTVVRDDENGKSSPAPWAGLLLVAAAFVRRRRR